MRQGSVQRALDILRQYDTVIIVDDSESMSWDDETTGTNRWEEVR